MKKIICLIGILLIIFGIVYTKHMADLTPQTIVDQPIPLLDGTQTDPSGTNSTGDSTSVVIVPTTQVDKTFPQKVVASETISQSLNTETKRITGEYSFEQLGAFVVYSIIHPLASIKISGDGIAATDANGNPTFTLDGETGDATFAGTVKAGNVEVIDDTGLISLNNFALNGVTSNGDNLAIPNQWTDIANLSITFTLVRSTHILLMAGGNFTFPKTDLDGTTSGYILVGFNIDGTIYPTTGGYDAYNEYKITNIIYGFSSFQYLTTLGAGNHTVKLDWKLVQNIGTPSANCINLYMNYLILGS